MIEFVALAVMTHVPYWAYRFFVDSQQKEIGEINELNNTVHTMGDTLSNSNLYFLCFVIAIFLLVIAIISILLFHVHSLSQKIDQMANKLEYIETKTIQQSLEKISDQLSSIESKASTKTEDKNVTDLLVHPRNYVLPNINQCRNYTQFIHESTENDHDIDSSYSSQESEKFSNSDLMAKFDELQKILCSSIENNKLRLQGHKGFSERVFELWFNQIRYQCESRSAEKINNSFKRLKPCLIRSVDFMFEAWNNQTSQDEILKEMRNITTIDEE